MLHCLCCCINTDSDYVILLSLYADILSEKCTLQFYCYSRYLQVSKFYVFTTCAQYAYMYNNTSTMLTSIVVCRACVSHHTLISKYNHCQLVTDKFTKHTKKQYMQIPSNFEF